MSFVPLTPGQVATVSVTRLQAEQTAMANRNFAYEDSSNKLRTIIWKKVGCVFLGYRIEQPHMFVGPTPLPPEQGPAYLVQVLADPVPGHPGANVAVVVVDAVTGGSGEAFAGGGPPPYGVFGTTCGVTI